MPTLHVRLLGDFRLTHSGAPVIGFNSARMQTLLAYILLHRAVPQSRSHLAFLFWPDSTEKQAHSNLRTLLHRLRNSLPDADRFFYTDAKTVQWRSEADFTLDVADFTRAAASTEPASEMAKERLAEAVRLYRGDLLPGCYDDWILSERERLQQRFVGALERLIRLLEEGGETMAALSYSQRLLQHDPLRETSYQRLMRLHALNGDRAGALRVYRHCELVLQHELALQPSQATREMLQTLLAEAAEHPHRQKPMPPLRRALTPRHNLPFQLTSFIGREQEMAAIKRQLGSTRLLTLSGPGGCGKSRLALQAAGDLFSRAGEGDSATELEIESGRPGVAFQDGVWWVELAGLADAARVPQAVAAALGVREQSEGPLVETLVGFLTAKRLLLVLDNCEHLVAACARLADLLLHRCPNLRILATSREALGVAGEVIQPVPSLSFPAASAARAYKPKGGLGFPKLVSRFEAVRLFVERAEAALPTFAVTTQNAAAIARICRRLDGIPLALELAAVRVTALSPEQIAARLDDRFRLLTVGARTALPRHRTLRAAIDWSYDLLSEQERAIFERLSVFAGGFTLEAAEGVCAGQAGRDSFSSAEVLDLLARLVDKSLVEAATRDGAARYRLLETLRQYAHERLRESGGEESLRQRHARYFLRLTEEAEPHLIGSQQVAWLNRLEMEHDNLRAALAWSQRDPAQRELGLRLAVALSWFWVVRGHWVEGRNWLVSMLGAAAERPEALEPHDLETEDHHAARALSAAGTLAWYLTDYAAARAWLQAGASLWRALGDKRGLGRALTYLGLVALRAGDYATAGSLLDKSLALFRAAQYAWGQALVLNNMGNLATRQRDYPAARTHFESALAMRDEFGDTRLIAILYNGLGELARCEGRYGEAVARYDDGLALTQEIGAEPITATMRYNKAQATLRLGDVRSALALFEDCLINHNQRGDALGVAMSLSGLATVAAIQGRLAHATRLFGAANGLLARTGATLAGADQIDYDRDVAALRAQMEETAFAAAWETGCALTLEQAIEAALQISPAPGAA